MEPTHIADYERVQRTLRDHLMCQAPDEFFPENFADWICRCGETNPPAFGACWLCGAL